MLMNNGDVTEGAARTRGRRTGSPDTRGRVLEIARRRFLADGYRAVTLRSVATEAGVDVALISYFFGSKRGLFGAALGLAANPAELLRAALPGDRATMPERVLRTLLTTWDDPVHGPRLRVLATTVAQEPEFTRMFRELVQREMTEQMAEYVGGADAPARAAVFTTQLAGVIFARYVLALEPIASLPADELVRHLVPGLRAVLYGPVGVPRRR
ncbi:TetR family transcriptional regulator [Frankia sp. AgB1.9]|uniref:TetR/AcrR family transcriptional regulator n=1 Tax=unclassified Frankia TaxID=2632575 RepID=UPI001932F914|nr:TetR family transcriptional regulator [Frankia sp. AgW1.1]MBL7552685.1 TetR family transcriptional regulator [Frankia sp. AgB1.9]MBL7623850.1 TetR family transcriptional regulator [Frankia sp. AgB1.8]